jgi:hypothetical protein
MHTTDPPETGPIGPVVWEETAAHITMPPTASRAISHGDSRRDGVDIDQCLPGIA